MACRRASWFFAFSLANKIARSSVREPGAGKLAAGAATTRLSSTPSMAESRRRPVKDTVRAGYSFTAASRCYLECRQQSQSIVARTK